VALKVSIVNHAAVATWSSAFADPAYPALNLASPQRPFMPAKTTSTAGTQRLIGDFGSAKAVDVFASIHRNSTTFRFQADDASTFDSAAGSPQYDSGVLTAARNPGNGRYHHVHFPPSTVTRRYICELIPTQTPNDGALVYRNGGVWAGVVTTAPDLLRWGTELQRIEPHRDVGPDDGAWEARLVMGLPRTRIRFRRAAATALTPALLDDLATWLDLERQWATVDAALVMPHGALDSSQGWVMRREDGPTWTLGYGLSESATFTCIEVVGP